MTELAEGLVRRGHQVRVVTGMPNYPQRRIYEGYRGKLYITEQRHGVTVQRCYVRIRPQPGLVDRALLEGSFVVTSFFQALKGWRPDVILLTIPPLTTCVPAAAIATLQRAPIVLNVQDILPDAAVHTGLLTNQKVIRTFEILEQFAYRRAAKISVIAEGFVDNLREKNVDLDKIVRIPNWVDVDFICPKDKASSYFRTENGLEGKFIAMYSGNIALTQGLENVVKAAALLKDLPDLAIAIVGEERALEPLRELCRECEADNVVLRPFQPREKLPEMLAAADVGLVVQKKNVLCFNMPSKIPVILASGRPILASVPADGTAAKAVRESGGGIVVPPEDPDAIAQNLRELYRDRDRVENLGHLARQCAVDRYSFDRSLDRYESLFSSLTHAR